MTTMRRFRRPTRHLALCVGTLLALVATAATAAPGDLGTKFRVNDQEPTKDLPTAEDANKHPLEFGYFVQDLVARGEGAFQKKEWERGAKYYQALATVVPDRAISFRKMCSAYVELGKVDLAAASCGQTLSRGGARVWDHFRYLDLTLKKATLTSSEIADMEASITHLRAHAAANPVEAKPAPKAEPEPTSSASSPERTKEQIKDDFLKRREKKTLDDVENKAQDEAKTPPNLALEIELVACKVSVRLRDERKLGACVDALKRLGANPKLVLSFEWARALVQKDARRADELLARAKTLGLPQPALTAMVDEQRRTLAGAGAFGFLRGTGLVVALGVLASIGAAFGALRFSRALKRRKLAPGPEALPQ